MFDENGNIDDWTTLLGKIRDLLAVVDPQRQQRLHGHLFAAMEAAEDERRSDAARRSDRDLDLTGMKSFAGPWRLGMTEKRPDDCTCERWAVTLEPNRHADSGIDTVDWHEPGCGYWKRHIAREDWARGEW